MYHYQGLIKSILRHKLLFWYLLLQFFDQDIHMNSMCDYTLLFLSSTIYTAYFLRLKNLEVKNEDSNHQWSCIMMHDWDIVLLASHALTILEIYNMGNGTFHPLILTSYIHYVLKSCCLVSSARGSIGA